MRKYEILRALKVRGFAVDAYLTKVLSTALIAKLRKKGHVVLVARGLYMATRPDQVQ